MESHIKSLNVSADRYECLQRCFQNITRLYHDSPGCPRNMSHQPVLGYVGTCTKTYFQHISDIGSGGRSDILQHNCTLFCNDRLLFMSGYKHCSYWLVLNNYQLAQAIITAAKNMARTRINMKCLKNGY